VGHECFVKIIKNDGIDWQHILKRWHGKS